MRSFGQASKHYWAFASISSIHCLYPYAHCEIRACDMLCEGAKIDTGVLAGVAVGCW
jgi:hypothetical protein